MSTSSTPSAPLPPSAAEPPPPPADERPRLSKLITARGLGSRREADEWIENGWVKVDGRVVSVLGARVAPTARIEVDSQASRQRLERVTILLHKPVGVGSGKADEGRRIASELVTEETRWIEDPSRINFQRGHLNRLVPASSLDREASGLVVFTQDDGVARRLTSGDAEHEYVVHVEGALSGNAIKRLEQGLELEGGTKLSPGRVSWQSEEHLRLVLRNVGPGLVPSVCVALGMKATELRRIRIGSVPLAKLPPGQWRYLQRQERF